MQVNKIDNTSFGMALKIDKGLRTELKARPKEFLKIIDSLGEKVADIKEFHVCLEESKGLDKPIIRKVKNNSDADYFSALKSEESNLGRYYEIPMLFVGDSVYGFYPKEPHVFKKLYGQDAAKKYKEFRALDIYDQAAEYSRLLEKIELDRTLETKTEAAKKAAEEAANQAKLNQQEIAADELLNKYENDFSQIIPNTEPETTGFWDKLISFFKK